MMSTRLLFNVSSAIEVLTGVTMLIAPAFLIGLLLGGSLDPIGIAVARVLGIGLLSLGVAGWESQGQDLRLAPRAGLCIYNLGAATVFVILGTTGGMNGILLWPAMVLHSVIGAMMLRVISSR